MPEPIIRQTGYLSHVEDEKGWGKAILPDGSVVFVMRRDFRDEVQRKKSFPPIGSKLQFVVIPSQDGLDRFGRPKSPQGLDIEVL